MGETPLECQKKSTSSGAGSDRADGAVSPASRGRGSGMLARLLNLFRTRRLDRALDEELRHHVEALETEHRARGLSNDAARAAAARDMGGITQAREAYRDQRGVPVLETLWRDVRFGARSLRRTPGVTLAVVATLAI